MRNMRHNRRLVRHPDAHLFDGYLGHVRVPRDWYLVRQSGHFARVALEIATAQRFHEGVAQSHTGHDLDGGALLVGQVGAQKGLGRSVQGARVAFRLASRGYTIVFRY